MSSRSVRAAFTSARATEMCTFPVLFSILTIRCTFEHGSLAPQEEVADLRRQCSQIEGELLVKVTELTEAVKVGARSI